MTINLSDTLPISTQLANDIRLLFRPVSVVKPDMGIIMRAKASALGFKAPLVLGSRLKVLSELAKDQLYVFLNFYVMNCLYLPWSVI